MSHWTKVTTKIKDYSTLKKAAEKMGLEITDQETYTSVYAGSIPCVGVIHQQGQELNHRNGAAIVKEGDGYQIIMDNYGNPLTGIAGENCSDLLGNYATSVVQDEMMRAGFSEVQNEVKEENGDRVLIFQGM